MMRKIIIGVLIILSSTRIFALNSIENDSIKIFDSFYTSEDLDHVSIEFLRYARNYIFARQGYIFNDDCLNNLFNSLNWYVPNTNQIVLCDKEKEWVEIIKLKENNKRKDTYFQERFKCNFNGRPLYYIASDFYMDKQNTYSEYRSGYFYLLSKSDSWMLDYENIPAEIIELRATDKIRCTDDGWGAINKKDIHIINFDEKCINGHSNEIEVRLYGPSNDDGHIIIGYNIDNQLEILIKNVFIKRFSKDSDSTVIFSSTERCDRIGTEFCDIEYLFNTITKKYNKITQPEYQHTISATSRREVIVYLTEEGARNEKDIAFRVPPNSKISISHYLDRYRVYQVEYQNKKGWVSNEYLYSLGASLAD